MSKPVRANEVHLQRQDLDMLTRLKRRQSECEVLSPETRTKVSALLTQAFRLLEDAGYGTSPESGSDGATNGAGGEHG